MPIHQTDTLIVGAGPAGLAVAGQLTKAGIPFLLLEKAHQVTQSWHDHYERLCLHTVKEHSNLPHLELPEHYPLYAPRLDMIAYWEDYVKQFKIQPLFRQEVLKISRVGEEWIAETTTDVFQAKRVVVATGYNRMPNMPQWKGQDMFKGSVIHSREYKNPTPYVGKRVLVVGIGNTGAELALDLYEKGATPFISVRNPVNFVLRDVGGRPTQRTAIMLGKLPNWLYDLIARQIQKIAVGDLTPYGLPRPDYAPSEGLRRFGKVPVIDIGTLALIKQGKVKIVPDIAYFNADSVTFIDGREEKFDAVIACTGYKARVEDFLENSQEILNERGYPRSLWFDQESLAGLYFCGFSIPLSGILRNIKMDSTLIVKHIQQLNTSILKN